MKKLLLAAFAMLCILPASVVAQGVLDQVNDPFFGESCTSIMVGKKASTDGSVITSHTCDGRYRTWLEVEKGQKFKNDTTMEVYKGSLKTETAWDRRKMNVVGSIPQAKETYAYLNTAYPCLNEKQLAIGETTIVGPKELVNEKGMFLIEELERIALQRCTTARDAITLIGKLIKEYGYGDWGECITIADKHEVWQMEIFGEGPDNIGGVWAAQRIPDDHVGVSANISRIGKIEKKNKDYFMFSDNVFSVAKNLKRWDGKEEFKFWKAYGKVEKPFKIREFIILNALAPSLKLDFEADELPFSVKPDQKVSVRDVIALYRETYEGTEYDMTQNLKVVKKKYNDKKEEIGADTIIAPNAHPWPTRDHRNLRNYLKEGTIEYQRTVAVAWCSYSHIIQLRDWLPDEIGGRAWFSFDNPGQSPRVPIYSGTTKLPESFNFCGQKRYREDAAIWQYRKANKLATLQWQKTRKGMMEEVAYFEDKGFSDAEYFEAKIKKLLEEGKKEEATTLLNKFTKDFTGATMLRWKELENEYWGRFGLGF
ncbi:peptidase [Marinifilum breve]|uniref:Dipeptidase n=1 Tax=Marinifilum breve TaxID=2184082 RepID=A0A2V4A4S1_9BACT|nr:C69 family dipeptidase [Marinifilum breve]PXY02887.1 peptidase [Marinifilum breve]